MIQWARKHEKCARCGTTKRKHRARGLCVSCYYAQRYEVNYPYRRNLKRSQKLRYWAKKLETLQGAQNAIDFLKGRTSEPRRTRHQG